jgi:predicted dehydrogenase
MAGRKIPFPSVRWLRAHVARGALGQPYAIDGEYLYGRLHKITDGWRGDVEDYSVVLGGGIHLADLMLWVLGERPTTVWAAGNGICTRGTAFRTDDFVAATLRFPSGALGRLTANFGCVHRHQHVVRVYGTEATFLYDAAGPRLHEARDPRSAPRTLEASPLPESKGALIAPFVEAILADEDLGTQTRHLFDTISVCLACDASLAAGAAVAVEYV